MQRDENGAPIFSSSKTIPPVTQSPSKDEATKVVFNFSVTSSAKSSKGIVDAFRDNAAAKKAEEAKKKATSSLDSTLMASGKDSIESKGSKFENSKKRPRPHEMSDGIEGFGFQCPRKKLKKNEHESEEVPLEYMDGPKSIRRHFENMAAEYLAKEREDMLKKEKPPSPARLLSEQQEETEKNI